MQHTSPAPALHLLGGTWIASCPTCGLQLLPNDPNDDGNALAGVWYAVLIEAGFAALVAFLVALMQWLF